MRRLALFWLCHGSFLLVRKPLDLRANSFFEHSGLDFINEITEDDSLNILESEFVYNGAGVAIGDVNGDGLDDLFFAGNQVQNRLYLNGGNLKFTDISK